MIESSEKLKICHTPLINKIILLSVFILVIDLLFIGSENISNKWKKTILNIQGSEMSVNPTSAIFTYILIIAGVMIFVYPTKEINYTELFIHGFLWGFITYGIFDFTNLTIFKNYPLSLALIDSIWGGILIGTSVTLTYSILK